MRADNDNRKDNPFAMLPLFAADKEIAVAIVGKARAEYWVKAVLPTLKNFPPIDSRHQGRPVPLVEKFYDSYLGVTEDFQSRAASGEENWSAWKKPRKKAA